MALIDPIYGISDYFSWQVTAPRDKVSRNSCYQLSDGICSELANWRDSDLPVAFITDSKCDDIRSLSVATESHLSSWREWFPAIACSTAPFATTNRLSEIERKFATLAEQWRRDTAIVSSSTLLAMHPAYQRIIGMGESAVPLILRELSRESDHWFWALTAITCENPVSPDDVGNLEKMSAAWLQLGRERGWI